MQLNSLLFVDVADAIGLGNPAIVEKDYYVVQLLKIISSLSFEYHDIVFSGGTALAKSSINTYRMSEDVDIKLVPKETYSQADSRSARRKVRKAVKQLIEETILQSHVFIIEQNPIILNEYQYFCFDIRFPQEYQQAPCLRPFIKLEFIESDLLSASSSRPIQSIYAEVLKQGVELNAMNCSSILDTQAEKLLSMLRRTASVARNLERDDDETLIRHIYDTWCIQQAQASPVPELVSMVAKALKADIWRYGNQHPQLVKSPIEELRYGLHLLQNDPKHEVRYNDYISPMVYADNLVTWQVAFNEFKRLADKVLDLVLKLT